MNPSFTLYVKYILDSIQVEEMHQMNTKHRFVYLKVNGLTLAYIKSRQKDMSEAVFEHRISGTRRKRFSASHQRADMKDMRS